LFVWIQGSLGPRTSIKDEVRGFFMWQPQAIANTAEIGDVKQEFGKKFLI
jgi:hypothetical protein